MIQKQSYWRKKNTSWPLQRSDVSLRSEYHVFWILGQGYQIVGYWRKNKMEGEGELMLMPPEALAQLRAEAGRPRHHMGQRLARIPRLYSGFLQELPAVG